MIVIRIQAGLGNQMFQYAFGYSSALKNSTYLLQDIGNYYYRKKQQIHPRAYKLFLYNTSFNKYFEQPIDNLVNALNAIGISCNSLRDKYIRCCSRLSYINEDEITFHNINDNSYLSGFWQSDHFFKDYSIDLRKEFKLTIELDELNIRLLEEIISTKNSVSLHFRRGDYNYTHHLDRNYYITALNYLKSTLQAHKLRVFVFSDDPHSARNCFFGSVPDDIIMSYVDINGEECGHFDLELMRNCNHHIIANSSFSWWGAWLSEHNNKIVIAPKLSSDRQHLFARPCSDWVTL